MSRIWNALKLLGPKLNRDEHPLYLFFVPTDPLEYRKKCEDLARKLFFSSILVVIIVVLILLFLPPTPVLSGIIRPFLLCPFINFAILLVAFFAATAFIRLRWLSKLDTTSLAWLALAAGGSIMVYVYFVAAFINKDVSIPIILGVSILLFGVIFSRFFVVGWQIIKEAST